jgi:hypothetical protein
MNGKAVAVVLFPVFIEQAAATNIPKSLIFKAKNEWYGRGCCFVPGIY